MEADFAYSPDPDVLWTHPETGAKVYVGCHTVAANLKKLEKNKIYHIINT
jgi:hypothetical protein